MSPSPPLRIFLEIHLFLRIQASLILSHESWIMDGNDNSDDVIGQGVGVCGNRSQSIDF